MLYVDACQTVVAATTNREDAEMTKYQLIVPTKIETAISGFVGAIEKTHRDRLFRVEFWRHGVVCTKNGVSTDWERLPAAIRKDAHAGCEILKQGMQMAANVAKTEA
jgi:hypothetical protein